MDQAAVNHLNAKSSLNNGNAEGIGLIDGQQQNGEEIGCKKIHRESDTMFEKGENLKNCILAGKERIQELNP
jgi:hypothetical protein